jgi:hypothetical protein
MDYCSVYEDQPINEDNKDNLVTPLLEEILLPSLFGYLEALDILKKNSQFCSLYPKNLKIELIKTRSLTKSNMI